MVFITLFFMKSSLIIFNSLFIFFFHVNAVFICKDFLQVFVLTWKYSNCFRVFVSSYLIIPLTSIYGTSYLLGIAQMKVTYMAFILLERVIEKHR